MSTICEKFRQFIGQAHGAALVVVGAIVSVVLLIAAVVAGDDTLWIVLGIALLVVALTAAWCTAFAARAARGRRRAVWVCLTIGLAGWAVGAALSVSKVPEPQASSVLSDAGFMLFWLATCVALILVPASPSDSSWMRLVLDAVLVGAALFAVAWLLVLRVADGTAYGYHRAVLLPLVYLAATVVVTTFAVLLVARARGRQRSVLVVLAIGIIVMALTRATVVHLSFQGLLGTAGLMGLGWVVGLLLIGSAGVLSGSVQDESVRASPLPTPTSLWLPYVPIVVAAGVATSEFISIPQFAPVVGATAVMAAAVLIRQFLVLRDNRRLLVSIAEQALRDPLTGIGNRALFEDRLTHAVHLRQRDRSPITVMVLDLDDFKFVNVSMGHPVGDALLADVADRLLSFLRVGDTLARLGSDEFAVLLEGSGDCARAVAHRVVQSFDEPFLLAGQVVLISPSIGLVALSGEDPHVPADVLLKRAEAAMHAAKTSGIALRSYSPDLDVPGVVSEPGSGYGGEGTGAAAEVRLLGELRRAIDRAELTLVYQPQVELSSGAVVGVEALVRWPHPRLGLLEPDRFLPLVRHHGLMPAVTDLVLCKALDDLAGWQRQGCATRVAVNLGAPSLGEVELPVSIAHQLARRRLPPEFLTIEITEDLMLEDFRRTGAVVQDLRARGIRISVDDFGSGYSALSYLREFPIDELKICRPLIEPIVGDARADAVVRAVVDLAHILGAAVVAEGVENQATGDRLHEIGCDIVQGYHYYRPMTAEVTTQLLCVQQRRRFDTTVTG